MILLKKLDHFANDNFNGLSLLLEYLWLVKFDLGQDYPKLADKPSTTVSPSWNSSTPNSADFDDVTDGRNLFWNLKNLNFG